MNGEPRHHSRSDATTKWLSLGAIAATLLTGTVVALLMMKSNQIAAPTQPELHVAAMSVGGDFPSYEHGGEQLDITLHNRGDRRAVVTGARLHVADVAMLPKCHPSTSQVISATDATAEYEAVVRLPIVRDDVIRVDDVRHSLPGDSVDRFVLNVRSPSGLRGPYPHRWIVRFTVALVLGDGNRTRVKVGDALVPFPTYPLMPEHYRSARLITHKEIGEEVQRAGSARTAACWRSNARKVRRLVGSSAKRSRELRHIARQIAR